MDKIKVLWLWVEPPCVAEFFPPEKVDMVRSETINPPPLEQELRKLATDVEVIIVRRSVHITKKVIQGAKRLKLIYKLGGVARENIDVGAAHEAGVSVGVLPMSLDMAVAEHSIMLMLALSKKLIQSHHFVVTGGYEKFDITPEVTAELHPENLYPKETVRWNTLVGHVNNLYHKTLGIVGMGNIGTAVVDRARTFGMKIHYYKRQRLSEEEERRMGIQYSAYHDLLRISDYVNLLVPHTVETDKMLGQKELAIMKRTAFVINVSRGGIIDEKSLVEALKNGVIAGAGLDVFEKEPAPQNNPLLKLDNVILTPHNAVDWPDGEHVVYDYRRASEDLFRVIKGERPQHCNVI